MRPLTDRMPKPLVAVAGKPLIDHTLDRFAAAGVDTAIVNVHYLAGQIEVHLAARKIPKILISDERETLLDQGGGIAKVLPWLGQEPFFSPTRMLSGSKARRTIFAVSQPLGIRRRWIFCCSSQPWQRAWVSNSPGDFNMAPDGRLIRRSEREIAPFVYTGVGIIKPGLFAVETRDIFPLAPFFFEAAEKRRLFGQRLDGLWFHVGTPQAIEEAERKLARGMT